MDIKNIKKIEGSVALVKSGSILIQDVSTALDFMMDVTHQTGCYKIAVNKEAICEEFFHLSTRLAGEILQKFCNYRVTLAIYGDFSVYQSKPLRDFIYESNMGTTVFFTSTEEEAVSKLASV